MLLKISDDHLQHLQILHSLDDEFLKEFINISLQFLSNGINKKVFKTAAQKLQMEEVTIENVIIGLMQFFTEAAKYKLTIDEISNSLLSLEFKKSIALAIQEGYASAKTRNILNVCTPSLPAYDNLEWRLDIQLATRSLHQQITPLIRMKLHTSDGNENAAHMIQTDPVNLLHMSRAIDEALDELKSNHVRRILRIIT